MNKSLFVSIVLLVWVFSAVTSAYAQKVVLRPAWQTGKKYTAVVIQEMAAQNDNNKEEQIMSMKQKLGLIIRSEADRRKSMEISFDETRVKTNMLGGQQVEFDSADPQKQEGPLAPALNKLKDQKITLIYDEADTILEIRGLAENAAAEGPGSLSEEQIRTILGYEMARSLPAEAKKSGDKWDYQASIKNSELDLQIKAKVTFAGFEKEKNRRLAKVMFEGAVTASLANAKDAASATQQVKFSDASHYTGTMMIDTERHVLMRSDAVLHLGMEINGKPMTMKQKVLADTVSVEDVK